MKAPNMILLLLLVGCTEKAAVAPGNVRRQDTPEPGVFDPLTGTLDRARGVEATVLDSAAERREQIEAAEGR